MLRKRKLTKLKGPMQLGDSTRRRVARKATRSKLINRRLKQTTMRFEEGELAS